MKSAIAILTYNRIGALKTVLAGLEKHCPDYPIAIFEDCGIKDDTDKFLMNGKPAIGHVEASACTEYDGSHLGKFKNIRVFLGDRNLGVTGNSNRAIKWFEETGCDHLCLMNDDLQVLGDFVDFYAKAHAALDVGMFCFCDFTSETYKWMTVNVKGYAVKLLPRMTGILMSFTRAVVDKIGYYDPRFGKFGEEHCDYTIRARLAGFIKLNNMMQNCLDVEPKQPVLKHQEVETTVTGMERQRADLEAYSVMQRISREYSSTGHHRPFAISAPKTAGAYGRAGVPAHNLTGYAHAVEKVTA